MYFLTEYNKLQIMQNSCEKSLSSTLVDLQKYGNNLYEIHKEIEDNLKIDQTDIEETILKFFVPLRDKLTLLKNKEILKIKDYKGFKKDMIYIQENISNTKSKCKKALLELQSEEDALNEDLKLFDSLLGEWSKPINKDKKYETPSKVRKFLKSDADRCKEVKDFLDFLHKSGGHENGWKREDHLLFLKLYKQYKNVDDLARILNNILPDISEEEIKKHAQWYEKYCELNDNRKKAINKWREENSLKTNLNKKEKTESVRKIVYKTSPEHLKEKLAQWKLQKEEKLRNEKEILLSNLNKFKQLDEAKRKRNEEIKELISHWKELKKQMADKEIQEKRTIEENQRRLKAAQANKMIRQYQSQDDIYINRIRQRKIKDKFSEDRRTKSCQLQSRAKRDPKRLFKPTKQWTNRLKCEEPKQSFLTSNFINNIPKLAVPEWKKAK